MPIHTIKTNRGINNKGGAFFSSNFRADPKGGVLSDYYLTNVSTATASTISENLKKMTGFVQREIISTAVPSGEITIWGKCNTTGDLWAAAVTSNNFFRAHDYEQTASASRGIAVDVNNEIVYAGNRYLGRTITTETTEAIDIAENAIDVASVTGVPTAGQAFIKDGVGSSEIIAYTGITTLTLTGVTRGKHNTTDRAHVTGLEIVFFDDDWKDIGAADTLDRRPVGRFEDYSFVGNDNMVGGYKETDGSDWKAGTSGDTWITLPTGFKIVDFSTILTGAGYRCLIAANKENEGIIFVWDVPDTTFERKIKCNEKIRKLEGNLVGLESGIYKTDAYSINKGDPVGVLPDDDGDLRSADFKIYDMKIKENLLIVTADCNQYNRNRSGIWVLDVNTKDWFYLLPSNYGTKGMKFGAIFISSTWRILVSHDYNNGAIDLIGTSVNPRGNYYQFIYSPSNHGIGKKLIGKELKLGISFKNKDYYLKSTMILDIIVRYYDFTRPFLQYGQLAAASTIDKITISDSLGIPQVGDRIEIIKKNAANQKDVAGAPRDITAVALAASKYTCTLADDLPIAIDATTASAALDVVINPLKKIKKISITTLAVDLKDLVISLKDLPEFRKMMFEIEFRVTAVSDATISPRLDYVEISTDISEK